MNYLRLIEHFNTLNIVTWADSSDAMKVKRAFWHGNNHISVYRPGRTQSTATLSPAAFVQGADPEIETALLLHEYGHWKCNHPTRTTLSPETYKEEVQAYDVGKQLAYELFGPDWDDTVFEQEKAKGLKSYE